MNASLVTGEAAMRAVIRRDLHDPPGAFIARDRRQLRMVKRHDHQRPDGSEIFAYLDQERRHMSEICVLALILACVNS